jgi:hypothetical protein
MGFNLTFKGLTAIFGVGGDAERRLQDRRTYKDKLKWNVTTGIKTEEDKYEK